VASRGGALDAGRSGEQGRSSSPAGRDGCLSPAIGGSSPVAGGRQAALAGEESRRAGGGIAGCGAMREKCDAATGLGRRDMRCNWAGPYPVRLIRVSPTLIRIRPAYRIFAKLIKIRYSADTYPCRIERVSVSDTYPIRDTPVPWRIHVT
jgi:hypothetical protein